MASTVVASPPSHTTITAALNKRELGQSDDQKTAAQNDNHQPLFLDRDEARGIHRLLRRMSLAELKKLSSNLLTFNAASNQQQSTPPPPPKQAATKSAVPQHHRSRTNLRQRSVRSQTPNHLSQQQQEAMISSLVNQKQQQQQQQQVTNTSVVSNGGKPLVSFRGFLNLAFVLLAICSVHGILGELVMPRISDSHHVFASMLWDPLAFFLVCTSFSVFTTACFLVDRFSEWMLTLGMSRSLVTYVSTVLHTSILSSLLAETVGTVISIQRIHFAQGVIVMLYFLVTFMKATSFAIVTTSSRRDNIACNSPAFMEFVYFLFAPTLVYQQQFAKSRTMNWSRFLGHACASAAVLSLFVFLVECQLGPSLVKTVELWPSSSLFGRVDLVLLSSISYFVTWVVFFWGFFHHGVTACAELLCFNDRAFFDSWWNSTSVDAFWRSWNLLVQRWLFLHVYKPMVSRGVPKQMATIAVFVVSAIGHEVIISVPLRQFRPYAFTVMMLQIPAALISKRVFRHRPMLGNVVTWLWVMFSQCSALILYAFTLLHQQ